MSMNDLVESMLVLNEWTEGREEHTDNTADGIRTSAYGVVIDPNLDPKSAAGKAFIRNKRVAEQLGYDIEELTNEQAREVAGTIIEEDTLKLSKQIDGWEDLDMPYKLFLMDAKFNTGATYKQFAKQALKYQDDPTEDNLRALIKQSTRKQQIEKGQPSVRTEGLDNRSTKILLAGGILENEDQAREMGLTLTTRTGFADRHRLDNILADIRQAEAEVEEEEMMDVEAPEEAVQAASLDSGMIVPEEEDLLTDSVTGASVVEQVFGEPVPVEEEYVPTGRLTPMQRRTNIRRRLDEQRKRREENELLKAANREFLPEEETTLGSGLFAGSRAAQKINVPRYRRKGLFRR